jgi:HNH endonuclease
MKTIHLFLGQVKIDKEKGCLIYIGGNCNGGGYPNIRIGSKTIQYHRYLYERVYGVLPPGHEVHHSCETRKCLNLKHLKGLDIESHKKEHLKSHCKNGHEYTVDNTHVRPDGSRKCLTCRKLENELGNARRRKARLGNL